MNELNDYVNSDTTAIRGVGYNDKSTSASNYCKHGAGI